MSHAELALKQYIGLACGTWADDVFDFHEASKAPAGELLRWRVLEHAGGGAYRVNFEHIRMVERMVRAFAGQHSHLMIIYSAGLSKVPAILNPNHRQAALDYFRSVCYGMLAVEQFLAHAATDDPFAGRVRVVHARYFWRDSQLWRECLVTGFNVRFSWAEWAPFIEDVALNLASAFAHEQGCENLFKAWRRLVKKGSENDKVSLDRLYASLRSSGQKAFVNVQQPRSASNADKLERGGRRSKPELAKAGQCTFHNGNNTQLAYSTFRSDGVKWTGNNGHRLPPPTVGHDTSTAFDHPRQAGIEFLLHRLGASVGDDFVAEHGSLDIFSRAWVMGKLLSTPPLVNGRALGHGNRNMYWGVICRVDKQKTQLDNSPRVHMTISWARNTAVY